MKLPEKLDTDKEFGVAAPRKLHELGKKLNEIIEYLAEKEKNE